MWLKDNFPKNKVMVSVPGEFLAVILQKSSKNLTRHSVSAKLTLCGVQPGAQVQILQLHLHYHVIAIPTTTILAQYYS
jgi:hypothetical protein